MLYGEKSVLLQDLFVVTLKMNGLGLNATVNL